MAKIGPKVPPQPTQVPQETAKKATQGKERPVTEQQVRSVFERSGPNILSKLQGMNAQQLAKHLSFDDADMALLARTFYKSLKEEGASDRKGRSKLFAKAILKAKGLTKRGRINDLLDDEEEEDEGNRQALEELYEMIAEQLDSTPVFAQLVDEVTESVRKIKV